MPISDARKKANEKYIKDKIDELKIRVPKGKKELIQDFAKSKGKSLNSFVNEAIDKEMNVDNAAQPTLEKTEQLVPNVNRGSRDS